MTITVTAWDRSPDGGAGLARDTRVRWALEEVGHRTTFALCRGVPSRNPRICACIPSA